MLASLCLSVRMEQFVSHWTEFNEILILDHFSKISQINSSVFNPLKPNDPYRGRTAPLTSKRCILYIYSTNIGTEYFNL